MIKLLFGHIFMKMSGARILVCLTLPKILENLVIVMLRLFDKTYTM
jgi:hypothetical protein